MNTLEWYYVAQIAAGTFGIMGLWNAAPPKEGDWCSGDDIFWWGYILVVSLIIFS